MEYQWNAVMLFVVDSNFRLPTPNVMHQWCEKYICYHDRLDYQREWNSDLILVVSSLMELLTDKARAPSLCRKSLLCLDAVCWPETKHGPIYICRIINDTQETWGQMRPKRSWHGAKLNYMACYQACNSNLCTDPTYQVF